MSRLVVLMYHALYADERERCALDAAERPYAVSVAAFEEQLDLIARLGLEVADPSRLPARLAFGASGACVLLTFDDGHGSAHRHALPRLLRRGLRAAFFATTDFIGRRAGHCGWSELRELADAGMTIGSHGRTHRFLEDLGDEEARAELFDSKALLEEHLGRAVTQISFPGGRYRARDISVGKDLGYRVFHTSRIGAHRAAGLSDTPLLCRVAVKSGTTAGEFERIATASPSWLWRARLVGGLKGVARRVMGNEAYHAVYERAARGL